LLDPWHHFSKNKFGQKNAYKRAMAKNLGKTAVIFNCQIWAYFLSN
jgi:hypothetical protein